MVLKLFGLLDLMAAGALLFLIFGVGEVFAITLAIYLFIKGLFFLPDPSSFLDLLGGFYIAIFILGIGFSFLNWFFIIWLAQKGVFSLLLGLD